MDLNPGDQVEKYVVESELGRGGMAVVFRVRHTTLDAPAALKLLTLSSKEIRERLLREGQIQAKLRHPNIVAVTDVIEHDGQPGLVMEFVDGPDLDDWIKERDLDANEAEQIFRQIVAGVAEAHANDVIHRDLKPANVLMAGSEGGWIPKVADFGLTKVLAGDDGMAKTRSGLPMGTPSYMPPEQIASAKDVDHRADIWSLGCILYELCTGRRPFDGQDLGEVFDAVRSAEFTPLSAEVPAHLRRVVEACLQPKADDRPDSCAEILKLLDAPLVDEAVPVHTTAEKPRSSGVERPLLPVPRQVPVLATLGIGGLVAGGAAAMLVIVGFLAVCLGGWGDPCATWVPGTIGYARAGALFFKDSGDTWFLRRDTPLYDDYPREWNDFETDHTEVCTLPAGTEVTIGSEPIRPPRLGVWVPVGSGSYTLPEDDE